MPSARRRARDAGAMTDDPDWAWRTATRDGQTERPVICAGCGMPFVLHGILLPPEGWHCLACRYKGIEEARRREDEKDWR
jgi:hypothetical protein